MMEEKKVAAIYARVSTGDQNCDRQVADLKRYAKKLGYEIHSIHRETASGAKNDRAVRGKVIELAMAREVDVILVTELSRWGRSTVDLLGTLKSLSSRGVSVVAQSGQDFDLSSATGEMLVGVLAVLAQFERRLIQERVKSGLENAKAKGKKLGRAHGDNYKTEKHEKKVMKLHAEGLSYRQIAREVNISFASVRNIVKRCTAA